MKLLAPAMVLALIGSVAAQSHRVASTGNAAGTTPAEQFTITNYYKQDVYDGSLNFVGTVDDVLIDQQGKITALIIGVGGFLGIGHKDFSESFGRVQMAKKNDKWYLVMDADKERLKRAPRPEIRPQCHNVGASKGRNHPSLDCREVRLLDRPTAVDH
jgi:sporulation protein YlmC with PRC-barrel domain